MLCRSFNLFRLQEVGCQEQTANRLVVKPIVLELNRLKVGWP